MGYGREERKWEGEDERNENGKWSVTVDGQERTPHNVSTMKTLTLSFERF